MADLESQKFNRNTWEEVVGVQGKTWYIQNTGSVNVRIFATDGSQPSEYNKHGEVIKPLEWSKAPVSIAAGEKLWAIGNTLVFLREVV